LISKTSFNSDAIQNSMPTPKLYSRIYGVPDLRLKKREVKHVLKARSGIQQHHFKENFQSLEVFKSVYAVKINIYQRGTM